jgi:hypothetical protein
MRAYIITSGAIFGLVTLAHILRAIVEGSHVATSPGFIVLTLLSAALCIWAITTLRRPA